MSKPAKPMTREAASRIQSVQAKNQDGQVKPSDFAARALRAAALHNKAKGTQ